MFVVFYNSRKSFFFTVFTKFVLWSLKKNVKLKLARQKV